MDEATRISQQVLLPRVPHYSKGANVYTVGTNVATFSRNGYTPDDGTSASTPIVAALFNRIIEERLRVGKGPLGFVNPTLYKHSEALNDVVHGKNGYCHKDDGFAAAPGWV